MIARKSDSLRAQEVLEAIFEMNERIKAFDITEDQFLHANDVRTRMTCGRGRWRTPF